MSKRRAAMPTSDEQDTPPTTPVHAKKKKRTKEPVPYKETIKWSAFDLAERHRITKTEKRFKDVHEELYDKRYEQHAALSWSWWESAGDPPMDYIRESVYCFTYLPHLRDPQMELDSDPYEKIPLYEGGKIPTPEHTGYPAKTLFTNKIRCTENQDGTVCKWLNGASKVVIEKTKYIGSHIFRRKDEGEKSKYDEAQDYLIALCMGMPYENGQVALPYDAAKLVVASVLGDHPSIHAECIKEVQKHFSESFIKQVKSTKYTRRFYWTYDVYFGYKGYWLLLVYPTPNHPTGEKR